MRCGAVPVVGARIISAYGPRASGNLHSGIDLGAPEGTPVRSVLAGRVVLAAPTGQLENYGNVVVVQHAPGFYSLSAHLAALSVSAGEYVDQGAELGRVGRTAGTRADPWRMFAHGGAHLHLEFLERWPPRGVDLDRLDAGRILGELGVVVPARGPLQSVCELEQQPTTFSTQAYSSSSVVGGRGGLGVLGVGALLYALSRLLRSKPARAR